MAVVDLNKLLSELQAANIPMLTLRKNFDALNGIEIDFPDSATQAQRDQAAAIIAAYDPSLPIGDYVRSHAANRRTFLKALYQYEQTINLHTTPGLNLLADYQAALTAAMTVVNTLPQPYIDNLNKLRDLDGVAVAVATMTLAQCRQFSVTLRGWLLTRAVFADTSAELLDV